MEDTAALALMLRRSGRSADSISRELGKSRNWLRMAIRDGNRPRMDTVAAVAAVTGHKLAVLDAETDEVVVTIEPPERAPERPPEGQSKAGETA